MVERAEVVEEINDGNLFLKKISKDDIDFVFKSLNEKNLTTYLSLGPLKTLEHSKRLIKGYIKYWDNYIQFNYIIEIHDVHNVKIGSISLWNVNWQHLRAQVGIWISPSFWNKGYAERSLNLIKNIAFNHLKLNRIEAYIAVENKKSVILFEKCGFQREGVLKQYLNFQGIFYNAMILSLLRSDFLGNEVN
jgi:ribosomal-protein-alanine N-acetyltransferase